LKAKYIEEIHKILEKLYEETKTLPFEEIQKRVHQNTKDFQKLVDKARQEKGCDVEVAQPL
jgi:hypothetical protein